MTRRRLAAALAPLLLAACTRGDRAPSRDSAFSRDLALAGGDSLAQPALRDVPSQPPALPPDPSALTRTPTPGAASGESGTRTTPAPPTASAASAAGPPSAAGASSEPTPSEGNVASAGDAGGGRVGVVGEGSVVRLSSGQRICTSTSRVGDRFTATVTQPVEGTNGARIPAGATLILEATQMKRSESVRDRPVIGFTVVSLVVQGTTYPVVGAVTQVQTENQSSDGAGNAMKKVATGAAVGAIVGQILGRDTRSTATAAGAGAVIGAAAAVLSANFDGCVPGGGRVEVTLTQPLQIRAE